MNLIKKILESKMKKYLKEIIKLSPANNWLIHNQAV